MKISRYVTIFAMVLAGAALSTPAFALTCAGGTMFTQNAGDIQVNGFQTDAAQACVQFSGNTMTVTLVNNTASITNVPHVLDGFSMDLAAGGGITLSGVGTPSGGFIDCYTNFQKGGSGPCIQSNTTFTDEQKSQVLTSPYGWGMATGSAQVGSGCTGQSFGVGFFAGATNGCFSLHPAGIAGTFANTTGPNDGPHNDLMLGEVTFSFNCTTACSGASNGRFYWGTDGTTTTTQVPEPASVMLLGTALAIVGKILRKRISA